MIQSIFSSIVEYLQTQLDFIYFFYGLTFVVLAVVCFAIIERDKSVISWFPLVLFGVFHGVNEWLDMVAVAFFQDSQLFQWMRFSILLFSFIFLLEFSRRNTVLLYKQAVSRKILFLFVALVSFGWNFGEGISGLIVFVRYLIALPAGIWAAVILIKVYVMQKKRNLALLIAGACMFFYACATGIFVAQTSIVPSTVINEKLFQLCFGVPVQLVRGTFVACMTLALWRYGRSLTLITVTEKARSFFFDYRFFMCLILVMFTGWFFAEQATRTVEQELRSQLLGRTKIVAAALSAEQMKMLSGSADDLVNPVYQAMKQHMHRIHDTFTGCRFVYLMGLREGKVFFYVDNEPETSPDYSPPGQIYEEAEASLFEIFKTGVGYIEGPSSDRWGTWVSGLEAMRDPLDQKIVAVLGIDIDAKRWKQEIQRERIEPIAFTLLFSILLISFFMLFQKDKITNAQLRESELRLLQAQRLARIGNWEFNVETGVMRWSDEIFRIIGRRRQDNELFLEEVRKKVIHPDDQAFFDRELKETIEKGKSSQAEIRIVRPNGSVRFALIHWTVQRNAANQVAVLRGTFQDITDRKLIEAKLEDQIHFLQRLIDTIPNPVFFKDVNGIYQGCNSAFEMFLGLSKEQIIGKTVRDILPLDVADDFYEIDRKLLETPGTYVYEAKLADQSGTAHEILFYKGTFTNLQGEAMGVVGLMLDVTEQKKLERQLRFKMEDMEKMNSFMVDRELKMVELKKIIENLQGQLSQKSSS